MFKKLKYELIHNNFQLRPNRTAKLLASSFLQFLYQNRSAWIRFELFGKDDCIISNESMIQPFTFNKVTTMQNEELRVC